MIYDPKEYVPFVRMVGTAGAFFRQKGHLEIADKLMEVSLMICEFDDQSDPETQSAIEDLKKIKGQIELDIFKSKKGTPS